ncbi:hypothetical protein [Priestia megaterium]|uniref:hypothetical protein n=1 Tax=Priestia megaterium TaxID=1404 RepID=UPI002E1A0ACD|nr:hypothetical protein [Priestia megaterium]
MFKKFRFLWFILLIFALIFVKNTFFSSSENAAETLATSDVPQAEATFKEGNNQQDGVIIQKYRKQLDAAQKKTTKKLLKKYKKKFMKTAGKQH